MIDSNTYHLMAMDKILPIYLSYLTVAITIPIGLLLILLFHL